MTGNRPLFWAFLFFLACFFTASFYLASHRSLCETLEAESALIAKAFYEGRAHLINQLNGKEDLDKPPGFYWLISGLYRVSPSWEVAARLPSIGSLVLFFFLFWKLSQYLRLDKGFLALWCLVFVFCPKIFWMSQIARMDLLFSSLCFLSIYFFIRIVSSVGKDAEVDPGKLNKNFLTAFFLTAGLSVMVKGPVGAVLIFGTVGIFLIVSKRFYLIREIFLSPYMLVFLAVCLPWYVYVILKTDFRFFYRFILEENLSRFSSLLPGGSFKEFNHSPPTRYLVYLLTGFFPWSLMVPLWCYTTVKGWRSIRPEIKVLFVYFWFVLVFFSLATSKRSDYILPLYPAASFLCANFLMAPQNKGLFTYALKGISCLLVTLFLCLFLTGVYIHFLDYSLLLSVMKAQEDVAAFILSTLTSQYLLFLLLFFIFLGPILINRTRGKQLLPFFMAAAASFFLVTGMFTLPAIYKGKDVRPFCKKVIRIVGSSPLYYAGFWDEECTFYLDRTINKLDMDKVNSIMNNSSKKVFFIVDKKRLKLMKKKGIRFSIIFKDNSLVLRPLFLVSR